MAYMECLGIALAWGLNLGERQVAALAAYRCSRPEAGGQFGPILRIESFKRMFFLWGMLLADQRLTKCKNKCGGYVLKHVPWEFLFRAFS